jgi:tetratricopeptide (TPR) repeat protein/O-antigen ligase
LDIWDYLVSAGIGLLIFFTPFASGGVEVWAIAVAEGICFSLAILWLGKSFLSARGRGGFPTLARREFRALALAVSAFLGLLLFQLVTLPPPLIKLLSPHSYELYQKSLPGWPSWVVYGDPAYLRRSPPRGTVTKLTVLPTVDEVKSGVAVPFAPEGDRDLARGHEPEAVPIAASTWRSLSVAPILTRAGLLKCTAYAALFFVVVFYRAGAGDAGADRKFRRLLLLIMLASGIAVAMAGLSQQAFSYGRSVMGGSADVGRARGPFVNPDHFANYLAMVLPLAVAGALFRVPLEPAQARFSGFQLLCAGVALILAAAIVVSLSRAGWIEIGLGIFIFAYLLRNRRHYRSSDEMDRGDGGSGRKAAGKRAGRWVMPLGLGLLAVAMASLMLVGPGGREQAGARVAESVSGGVGFWDRIDTWVDSAGIVRDYPVFGSGLDSWPTVFPRYQRPPWTMFFAGEAQNDYVEVAAECGIVGLVLLGWLCWKIGRYLFDGAHSIPTRHWALFAALIPAVAIMGFHETLDFCMQIPANALLFVLLVAIALRLVRTYGGTPIGPASGAAARIAVPAAIGLAAIAGLVGIAYQRETVYPDDVPYPASIRDNEAVILSHPASPIPHLWLAERVYKSSGAWLTRELQSAIWLDPTNPAGRDLYVQALLGEGKNQEALREVATATYMAPSLGNHSYLNARLIQWLPKDERAAAEGGLRKASASGFAGSTDGLAELYLAEDRQLDAARLYEAAAQREQDTSRKFGYNLAAGVAYAQAGKRDEAEKILLAAISIVPDDPRSYSDLIGMIYGPEKNAGSATRIIQIALRNGVDPAPLYLALEDDAVRAGDAKLAEAALRAAIKSQPSFSNWMRLGGFYLERGKYERAGEAIHRALEINPQSGEAYYYLAQAEEGTYQYPAARADYQRAAALAPDHPEFRARSLDLAHKIAEDSSSRQ